LGLRLGPSYGLSYKSFLSEKLAVEALFSSRYYGRNYGYYTGNGKKPKYWANASGPGATLTALLEYHLPFPDVKELQWYIGGGIHIGSWKGYTDHPYYPEDRNYFTMGVDFIIGMEYQFTEVPIVLALDFKPAFDFVGATRSWADEAALSIRFLLDKL